VSSYSANEKPPDVALAARESARAVRAATGVESRICCCEGLLRMRGTLDRGDVGGRRTIQGQAEQYAALHQPPDTPPAGPIFIRQLTGGAAGTLRRVVEGRPRKRLHLFDGEINAPTQDRC
jgi:hypothetical protein